MHIQLSSVCACGGDWSRHARTSSMCRGFPANPTLRHVCLINHRSREAWPHAPLAQRQGEGKSIGIDSEGGTGGGGGGDASEPETTTTGSAATASLVATTGCLLPGSSLGDFHRTLGMPALGSPLQCPLQCPEQNLRTIPDWELSRRSAAGPTMMASRIVGGGSGRFRCGRHAAQRGQHACLEQGPQFATRTFDLRSSEHA